MARSNITDPLRSSAFWLMDIASMSTMGEPIFSPVAGFSTVSMPEITLEMEEVPDGTFPFKHKVVKGGDISNITLERGATFRDSEFYGWVLQALYGHGNAVESAWAGADLRGTAVSGAWDVARFLASKGAYKGSFTPRRDLLLIHFFTHKPGLEWWSQPEALVGSLISKMAETVRDITGFASGPGPFEFAARVPARAFLLHNCIPVRYKPGSDFDASNSGVSLMELEVAVEGIDQINL